MKIFSFKISGEFGVSKVLISSNDSVLGLVCSVLGASKVNKCLPFEIISNDKFINDTNRIYLYSKLKNLELSDYTNLTIRVEGKVIDVMYIGSSYVNADTSCIYPFFDCEEQTVKGIACNCYYRMVYWDLKFGYGKLLNERLETKATR